MSLTKVYDFLQVLGGKKEALNQKWIFSKQE
jgi:hypothetical protein